MLDHFGVAEANWRDAVAKDPFFAESESPFFVGQAVAALAADPGVRRKAGQVLFAADLAEEYGFTDVDGRRPGFFPMFQRVAADPRGRATAILRWTSAFSCLPATCRSTANRPRPATRGCWRPSSASPTWGRAWGLAKMESR